MRDDKIVASKWLVAIFVSVCALTLYAGTTTPLLNALLQSNMNGNQHSITNLDNLSANSINLQNNILADGAIFTNSFQLLDGSSVTSVYWDNSTPQLIFADASGHTNISLRPSDGSVTFANGGINLNGDSTANFAGKVSGIAPTISSNFTTMSYVTNATNVAIGYSTNAAKTYTDGGTNAILVTSTNASKAYTDGLTNQIQSYVTNSSIVGLVGSYHITASGVSQFTVGGLALSFQPTNIQVTMSVVTNGYALFAAVITSSITTNGFTAIMNGQTQDTNTWAQYLIR